MGNSIAYIRTHVLHSDVHSMLLVIPEVTAQTDIQTSNKLFKTMMCTLEKEGLVYTKIYVKRDPASDSNLKWLVDLIQNLHMKAGNFLVPCKLFESSKVAMIARQYWDSTLYQKIHKAPFLNAIEKNWLAYLVVKNVALLHQQGVCHGDFKSDNFLISSWLWLKIADPAPFKPVYLPEGDFALYKCFFITSKRDCCLVAPERFITSVQQDGQLDYRMDLFSLGCVLAEIFLDGNTLFTHPALLSYRRGDFKPDLERIPDQYRQLVQGLIELDPNQRIDANQALSYFPDYFESLYDILDQMANSCNTSDLRLQHIIKQQDYFMQYPDTFVIISHLIGGGLRTAKNVQIKLKSIDLLLQAGYIIDTEYMLHRIIPWILSLLNSLNEQAVIKVNSLEVLIKLIDTVTWVSERDSGLYDKCIWPVVNSLRRDENTWVICCLAQNFPNFIRQARLFAEFRQKGDQDDVYKKIISIFKDLLQQSQFKAVKEKLLENVGKIAEVLGRRRAICDLLPHLIPCFKGQLKYTTLLQLSELVQVIGKQAFLQYIFPCIIGQLSDEYYAYLALKAMRHIEDIDQPFVFQTIDYFIPLLKSFDQWVWTEAQEYLKKVIQVIQPADNYCFLRPKLCNYLDIPRSHVFQITKETLDYHLIHPQHFEKIERRDSMRSQSPKTQSSPNLRPSFPPPRKYSQNVYNFSLDDYESPKGLTNLNPDGRLLCVISEHEAAIPKIDSQKGFLITGSNDGTMRIWNLNDIENFISMKALNVYNISDQRIRVRGLSLHNNKVTVSGELTPPRVLTYDVSFIQLETKAILNTVDAETSCLMNYEQDQIIYSCLTGYIESIDLRTKKQPFSIEIGCEKGIVTSLTQQGPSIIAGTAAGQLLIYDTRFNSLSASYCYYNRSPILDLKSCYYQNAPHLVVASGSEAFEVSMWNLVTNSTTVLLNLKSDAPITSPSFTPQSNVIRLSRSNKLPANFLSRENWLKRAQLRVKQRESIIKDWASWGHTLRKSFESGKSARCVLAAEDGKWIITGSSDRKLRFWTPFTPQNCKQFGSNVNYTAQYLPDVLIVSEYEEILQNSRPVHRDFEEAPTQRAVQHNDDILDLSISEMARGSLIVSSSRDGSVRVWQ